MVIILVYNTYQIKNELGCPIMQENIIASKVALVTGSARRIGASISRFLHDAGMNIVLHYHTSAEEAKMLCAALNQKRPHSAMAIQADLLKIDGYQAFIEQAASQWGRLDVLVNNASRFYKTPLGDVSEVAWDDLMDSNLKAPFFLAQTAAPFIALQQGSIINITDIHGKHPMRDYMVYCISKSGLVMMTKGLAKELGPKVRVNAVAPGAIVWPEGENAMTDALKQKIMAQTNLQKNGSPDDIAKAVLFLVRDASYITGQVIHVNGGRYN
jgi:pteridine reductase